MNSRTSQSDMLVKFSHVKLPGIDTWSKILAVLKEMPSKVWQ